MESRIRSFVNKTVSKVNFGNINRPVENGKIIKNLFTAHKVEFFLNCVILRNNISFKKKSFSVKLFLTRHLRFNEELLVFSKSECF